MQGAETSVSLTWARRVAQAHSLPLATILAWDRGLLVEEIGQVLVTTAEHEAARLLREKAAPPDDTGVFARAVRAFHAHLRAAEREQMARENDAAFAELIAQGAFGG